MKIHISFMSFKKIRSVFNENTNQFYELRKNQICINENVDKFLVLKTIRFEKFRFVLC